MDRLRFSDRENRHLGEEIEAAGGVCLLDMRVRPGGSHHQKFVVLRHPQRPWLDVAFLGGIDLCHSRRDDRDHDGDPQSQPMATVYGRRPPWHDLQLAVRGPAVGDIEATFCDALRSRPGLLLVAVLPLHPDRDGVLSLPLNAVGRNQAVRMRPRPAGRLRIMPPPAAGHRDPLWARALYGTVYDPDGRSRRQRHREQF